MLSQAPTASIVFIVLIVALVRSQPIDPVVSETASSNSNSDALSSSTPLVAIVPEQQHEEEQQQQQRATLVVRRALASNYTRHAGERIRLECEFVYTAASSSEANAFNHNDFTLYWVKNYQELLRTRKGVIHVLRRNMTTV